MTVGSVASENVSSRQASANKKSDMMLSEQKKSASFVSSHSAATEGEAIMVQSYVSIAAQSEAVEEQTLGKFEGHQTIILNLFKHGIFPNISTLSSSDTMVRFIQQGLGISYRQTNIKNFD